MGERSVTHPTALMTRPPGWLGLFPLLRLISLLVTGLYLFVLPYGAAWRKRAARRRL